MSYSNTCSTQTLPQLQSKPTSLLPGASEKSNQRSQTGKHSSLWPFLLTTCCQPTVANTKFRCAFSAMTVPISLSLSTPVPILPGKQQCFQAPISRSPVSANIRQALLLLHTTEPQVSNYSRITLQMWQLTKVTDKANSTLQALMPTFLNCMATKPRSPTLQVLMPMFLKSVATKPRSPTLQVLMPMFSNLWQLNQGHRPSRFSCQCFSLQLSSPGMTPGSVAPRTVHSVRPGSTTT